MDIKSLIFGKPTETVSVNQYKGSTQKWLPVADIKHGIVITKDGRYLKILEILPVNFYLKSPIEQQNIIYYYASFLKIAPNSLQILTVTQKADIQGYINRMNKHKENENSDLCKIFIEDNIAEVDYLAANEAITHRFFMVFEYESSMRARNSTIDGIADCLREEEQTARRYLDMCGLEVLSPDYTDNFQLELIYSLLNKRTSLNQKLPLGVFDTVSEVHFADEDFHSRLTETLNEYFLEDEGNAEEIEHPIITDTHLPNEAMNARSQQWSASAIDKVPIKIKSKKKRSNAKPKKKAAKTKPVREKKKLFSKKEKPPELSLVEAGGFTVPDILAPSSVDFSSRDNVVVDGIYHSYLYLTGYGYPTSVQSGWLNPLVEAGDGINVSFTISKQSKDKILPKIAKTIMLNRSRMRDVGDTRQDYEELDSAISSGMFLKDEMNRNNEDFYYMHTVIEVTAEDADNLERKVASVENLCTSMGYISKRCDYKQSNAFLSCLPLLQMDEDIERKSKRNILTNDVAAAFPFSSFEICDQSGIMLGINLHNRSVCMLDIFDSSKYANANMSIVGMSGAGKTFLLQLIALRLRQQGIQVFIIAPLKGHEFRPACEAVGGTFIKLSPSSNDCINIMEIRKATLDTDAALHRTSDRGDSLLADKIAKLHIFFSLLRPGITEEERHYLDSALIECYKRFGINHNNNSLFDKNRSFKPMPILKDLHEVLSEQVETKMLALALSRFVTGSASRLGQHTNVDLSNKYIVLDISEMGKDLLPLGMFLALDFCWDKCRESRIEKKALLLDELWCLIGASSNPLAADYVLEIFKVIRGYGGAAIGATQDLVDYFALENGKYGKAIINNSRTKIVLPLEEDEAMYVKKIIGLSDEETLQIIRNRQGEGLLCAGHNRISVAFHATDMEYRSISSSRQDLEKYAAENM